MAIPQEKIHVESGTRINSVIVQVDQREIS